MKIVKITRVVLDAPKQYYDVINANPYNNFAIKTNSGVVWSHNCFFDEISFIKNKDVEIQKATAIDMMDTAIGGMKTRFLRKGKNPTLLVLASSKRSEKSFLEEHTKRKLADEGEAENTLIVDEAVWDIRPSSEYSGARFEVAVGNKFLASEVILEGSRESWINKGYRVLSVPIEFRAQFMDDIDRALCDYAGISSSQLTKYISGVRLVETKSETVINPFTKEILQVGNSPDDKVQYSDFFDLTRVNPELKYKPLFIHLDMSTTGDRTGIAGTWILGRISGAGINPNELCYQVAFEVAIEAPKGYQISFEKTRNFIYWLKEKGFNIRGVTSDTFQNASLGQDLLAKGYDYKVLSVDRVNNDKICEPYSFLKNCIYEKRIKIPYKSDLLTEELTNLERNGNTGKIDHPDGGRYGCFTGDTKISLVDGRELSLFELVDEYNSGKINYVYSFNEKTKIIEPKKIEKAWKTISGADIVEVVLDNGEHLRCTPNHRFMLRDSCYKEASQLKPGDSLMPLYSLNHKVVAVNVLNCKEDVYDLTIQDNHNFALSAGVFVHNSKDVADALCGSLYNASLHSEEYMFLYSDDISNVTDINGTLFSDSAYKQQIVLDFEEELSKLVLSEDIARLSEKATQDDIEAFGNDAYYYSQGIFV